MRPTGWHPWPVQRWFGLGEVPASIRSVVTLGNFDGVHQGHAAVLATLVAEARRRDALAVAVTFDPHPIAVLYPERAPESLTGLSRRLDLLADIGLDAVLVQTFTHELAKQTPREYVESVFVRALRARAVVIGHDVRFGVRNSGDFDTLVELGRDFEFDVVPLHDLRAPHDPSGVRDQSARRWSSTWVRELLADGDVAQAAHVLGRHHVVEGAVVHGDARGRELGYPTANLGDLGDVLRQGMVPADGVYAGWLTGADGTRWPAAVSVGTNPQFGGVHRRVEAYVLDRTDLDLYDQHVVVEFVDRLRGQAVFTDVDALIEQMQRDVARARRLLSLPTITAGEAHG